MLALQILETRPEPLGNSVKTISPSRRRSVQILAKADERDTERIESFERPVQVRNGAREPVM